MYTFVSLLATHCSGPESEQPSTVSPSHFDIPENEEADRLARDGGKWQQDLLETIFEEAKTIAKERQGRKCHRNILVMTDRMHTISILDKTK